MKIDLDRQRLAQEGTLSRLSRSVKLNEMVTVHLWDKRDSHKHAIYGALIPSHRFERALSTPADWDLHFYRGKPSAVGVGPFQYLRFGVDNGIEPLVINRDFIESQINYRKRTDYSEISEEFRLFHNLYHDRKNDEYVKIDDDGNEHRVAVVDPIHIQIRLKEIRQFLAIKEMYLSIQFQCYEFSEYSLAELGTSEEKVASCRKSTADGEICWTHSYYEQIHDCKRSYSVLEGKRLVKPLPKSQSGFAGFAEEQKKEYVDFIIDVDEDGNEIVHSCDPTKLNRYGNNPEAPYDITPVYFNKQVLEKYARDSKYSVEDSRVSCPWWSMHVDNHHDHKVIVWMRELSVLPYTEQLYWRSHNILPEGGLSKTYFERNVEAQFSDSDRPEHLFKDSYRDLQQESKKCLGWPLLLPLDPLDEHHFKGLRIPSTDEQGDFDELVLSLSKILIDSLNQKGLKKFISHEQEKNLNSNQEESIKGSIGILEIALNSCGVTDASNHITFLRKLQKLRSTGSAHRKGRDYEMIAQHFDIKGKGLRNVFAGILWKALDVLDYLILLVRSRQINPQIIEQNNKEKGYTILGQMIGTTESDLTDGAINEDEGIYKLDSKT